MHMKIYLETTVPNLLVDEDGSHRYISTKDFFERITIYDPFISEVVLEEVERCESEKRKMLRKMVEDHSLAVLE
jgi:hypothetical protein